MTTTDRASALWRSLIELFGIDAVKRKYGDTPPSMWRDAVASLSERELQRGMRRVVSSGKPHVPTLPELPSPQVAPWVVPGNQHLMAYVYVHTRKFGREWPSEIVTPILVRWKNEWVRLMQDSEPDDCADGGKALWHNCMQQAETEIARRLRSAA
jgi:hypothetical protein